MNFQLKNYCFFDFTFIPKKMANAFLKQIPEWIKKSLPEELVIVLKGTINEPKTKDRKEAIDADSVNDFAYHVKHPKKRTSMNLLTTSLEKLDQKPFDYSVKQRKFKCIAYLAIRESQYRSKLLNPLQKTKSPTEPSPMWYNYLYIYFINAEKIEADDLYYYIYNSDEPMNVLDLILSQTEKTSPKKLAFRKNYDDDKDKEFYISLSEENKTKVVKLVAKDKMRIRIKRYLLEEGNLERIFIGISSYKLGEYCLKMNKIDEFKQFVDSHRKYYSQLNGCHLIMPQFKELYEYAFSKSKFDNDGNELVHITARDHLIELLRRGFYREVKFMFSRGLKMHSGHYRYAMESLDDNTIAFLNPKQQQIGVDDIFKKEKDPQIFQELYKRGYRITAEPLTGMYWDVKLSPEYANFEVINKYVHPEKHLDKLKVPIAIMHTELLKDFIERFGNRLKNPDPETYKLYESKDVYKYQTACDVLGVPYTKFIDHLFRKSFKEWYEYGFQKSVLLYSLTFNVDVSNPVYIRKAVKEGDLKVVAALVRAGADPNSIHNWEKKVSPQMYKTIMNNL